MLAYIWIEANYRNAELNLNNTPEAIVLLRFFEGIGAGDRVLGVLGPSNAGNFESIIIFYIYYLYILLIIIN